MGGRGEGAHRLFAKGSLVEVRMNQDGFDGSWYVATIVDGPSEMKNRKKRRRSSSSSKYLVKYQTLFADDDGFEPLIEYVEDVSLMRPLPPTETTDHQRSFELKDIVDAFHRDGWWTGVISRVLDDSKYAVYFHNPPEEIEFASSDLRVHHEWVDCKWLRSEKERTMGLMFGTGAAVEVSFDREYFHGVWFVANVLRDLGNNTFLVECPSSSISGRAGYIITVDSLHIRPSPPLLEDKDFGLLQEVDAFYNFGWWSGVITKLIKYRRYIVHFKLQNVEKELNHSELRPHMNWIDGKWAIAWQGTEQQRVGQLDNRTTKHTRKRGKTKTQVKRLYHPAKGNEGNAGGYTAEEIVEKQCITEAENPLQLSSEPSLMDLLIYQRKKRGRPDYHYEGMPSCSVDELPAIVVNQPLLAYYPTLDDSSASRDTAINECNENQILPFEKCSPVWKVFECMEVFQAMPQKPHFYPLYNHEEVTREGLAIAHMVTFSSVVERMKKLKLGDPSSIIEATLKTILELESHGFDVESLRGRLSELLSKKEIQQELQEKSKEVEKEIIQQMQEKTKIDEEICETYKQQMELEKKIELALLTSKKKDKEIAAWQSKLDVIRVDLQSAQHDFERLVASPW